MALSEEKRREIADLLAKGGTERGVAESAGVSKRTVQNIKKDPKYAPILAAAQRAVTVRRISREADSVGEVMETLRDASPAIEAGYISISSGLLNLFQQSIEALDPAEITPPQLLGIAKSYASVVESYSLFTNRRHSLDILIDEINEITELRRKEAFSTNAIET